MKRNTVKRPWGYFTNLESGMGWHLKTIGIKPNSRLSLQSHRKRSETWIVVEGDIGSVVRGREMRHRVGDVIRVPKRAKHRLFSKRGGTLVEIGFGVFDEDDIIRYEDDYGRT
ncbi:MAG: phosphomannose isomerase type II C-terminal cupin domain [Parcubacteria group bacterium]|nr:phosphomannose isomerase type II C-terminal cupin domain [Parcubacteria group bacterium]